MERDKRREDTEGQRRGGGEQDGRKEGREEDETKDEIRIVGQITCQRVSRDSSPSSLSRLPSLPFQHCTYCFLPRVFPGRLPELISSVLVQEACSSTCEIVSRDETPLPRQVLLPINSV